MEYRAFSALQVGEYLKWISFRENGFAAMEAYHANECSIVLRYMNMELGTESISSL